MVKLIEKFRNIWFEESVPDRGPMLPRANPLLAILDSFLSSAQLHSANTRMRGRIAVFGPLVWVSLNILFIIFGQFYTLTEVIVTFAFLSIWLSSLFLIKNGFSPEKVVATALVINTVLAVLEVNFSTAANLFVLFGYLSTVYFACLVITNVKMRMITVLALLSGTLVCFLIFSKKAGGPSVTISSSMVQGLLLTVGVITIAQIILYSMVLRFRAIAQKDLDQEIEWQQRRIRLEEASSNTRIMQNLLKTPLHDFREGLKNLLRGDDSFTLNRMQATLDQLLLISQSYGWIYRAYSHEGDSASILSTAFLEQFRVLLTSKVEEKRWVLNTAHPGQPVEIKGPIPSIMLFLFSMAVHIVEEQPPPESRQLTVESRYKDKMMVWSLRWPFNTQDYEQERASFIGSEISNTSLRMDLIRELTQVCDATFEEKRNRSGNEILMSGPWRRLEG